MSEDAKMPALQYSALEKVCVRHPVDRLDFIQSRANGRSVFDLGALDETAFDTKQGSPHWLHARLCMSARSVVGMDNSTRLPAEGIETINGGRIVHADILDLGPVVEAYGVPDLIVAGELIEHLPDTLGFLRSLKLNPRLRHVEFTFSTPNACAWHNGLIGLLGRESMHRDHLQIYSYKTLRTLFERAEIELQELVPYHARFPEMMDASTALRRLGVTAFQRMVNTLEFLSPMLSAGWIGVARL